jgi:hypothetical protein
LESGDNIDAMQEDEPKTQQNLKKQFKREQTREENKRKKAINLQNQLTPEDVRGKGVNKSLASTLEELLRKTR